MISLVTVLAIVITTSQAINPFISVIAQPKGSSCEVDMWQTCISRFSDDLGVKMTNNATKFVRDMETAYASGKLTLIRTCIAQERMEGCTGPSGAFKTCCTLENLMRLGLTKQNAAVYYAYGKTINTECSPTYLPVLLRNEKCLAKTVKDHRDQITKCETTFTKKISEDPANYCKYGQEYITCYTDVYTECTHELQHAMCTILLNGLSSTLKCPFVCRQ